MAMRQRAVGLAGQVAAGLRAEATDPRRLAEELIRERLGECGRFLGDGTAKCPWVVIGPRPSVDFYAFYVRGRELVNVVSGRPDRVVCVL
jgi:hypothetical protein